MEWLQAILSSPWSLFIILIGAAIAQKSGLDVVGSIKWFFDQKDTQKEVDADNRNALQPLMSRMDELSLHYNHETTEKLTALEASALKTLQILTELKEYGIRIRKD